MKKPFLRTALKTSAKVLAAVLLTAILPAACAGLSSAKKAPASVTPKAPASAAPKAITDPEALQNTNWKLIEVKTGDERLNISRDILAESGNADFFTLTVLNEKISGRGAPNRFMGPVQFGENGALTTGQLAGTLMALLAMPEGIPIDEAAYYRYLSGATHWSLQADDSLVIESAAPEDGATVTLTFIKA